MPNIRGHVIPPKEQTVRVRDVPNSDTDVVTKTFYLQQVTVTNRTGAPITFSLEDRQSTPHEVAEAVSIAENSTTIFNWNVPLEMLSGFSHSASAATGLNVVYQGFSTL